MTALEREFYVDAQALLRAVVERRSANLIHHQTQSKVDVFVAGGTPLDARQLQRRRPVDLGGRVIYVHPPEDVLLQKLRWFRLSGDTPDRQWRDVSESFASRAPRSIERTSTNTLRVCTSAICSFVPLVEASRPF